MHRLGLPGLPGRRGAARGRNAANSSAGPFPPHIHAIFMRLPEEVERVLGLVPPRPGVKPSAVEALILVQKMGVVLVYMSSVLQNETEEVDVPAEALLSLRDGVVAVAMLRLVAACVRRPLEGPPRSADPQHLPGDLPPRMDILKADRLAADLCATISSILTADGSVQARRVFGLKLLQIQTFQAAARQFAIALDLPRTSGLAPKRAANGFIQFGSIICGLIEVFGKLMAAGEPLAAPFQDELVAALRDSRVLEHAARLLMRLMLEAGQDGAPQTYSSHAAVFILTYDSACARNYIMMSTQPPPIAAMDLAEAASGPCADHVAMALGLKALCAADGGPVYGLPREVVDALPALADGDGPADTVDPGALGALVAAVMLSHKAGRLGRGAAAQVMMRLSRLAVASARGHSRSAVQGNTRSQLRLPLLKGAKRAVSTLAAVWELLGPRPVRWLAVAEEWWRMLLGLCGAERAMERLAAEDRRLLPQLGKLLAVPLLPAEPAAAGNNYYLPPSAPPPEVAAALSAGLVPTLERVIRRAGEDPDAPESGLFCGVLDALLENLTSRSWQFMACVISFGDPRQAAALVTSWGKMLRCVDCTAAIAAARVLLQAANALMFAEPEGVEQGSTAGVEQEVPQPPVRAAAAQQGPHVLLSYMVASWLPALSQKWVLASVRGDWRRPLHKAATLWMPILAAAAAAASLGHEVGPAEAEAGKEAGDVASLSGSGASTSASSSGSGDVAGSGASTSTRAGGDNTSSAASTGADCASSSSSSGGGGGGSVNGGRSGGSSTQGDGGWQQVLFDELNAVAVMGAVLRELDKIGEGDPHDPLLAASACIFLAATFPEQLCMETVAAASLPIVERSGSAATATGRHLPWPPARLRALVPRILAARWRNLAAGVEALASLVEAWAAGSASAETDAWLSTVKSAAAPVLKMAVESARHLATSDTFRSLIRTCGNPTCTNFKGHSELGVKLQGCGGCGVVGYCCRECQTAHWRAGHKEACAGRKGGSSGVTGGAVVAVTGH